MDCTSPLQICTRSIFQKPSNSKGERKSREKDVFKSSNNSGKYTRFEFFEGMRNEGNVGVECGAYSPIPKEK